MTLNANEELASWLQEVETKLQQVEDRIQSYELGGSHAPNTMMEEKIAEQEARTHQVIKLAEEAEVERDKLSEP